MKSYSLLFLLLFTGISLNALSASIDTSDNPWEVIEEQNINGVSATLKLRGYPSIKVQNWVSIEFDNKTSKALLIESASYSIDCKVYDKKGGKLIKQGRIASRSAAELLDKSLDSPFPMMNLSPGLNVSSRYPSIVGAVLLAVPDQEQVYVEASLNLYAQLAGAESFVFNWEEIPFTFIWSRPQPVEFSDLYQHLNQLLAKPVNSSLHHYELLALLSAPEISKGIEIQTLLEALKKRSGKDDGRLAVLYHLNDHFNGEKDLLDYYFELLKAKDNRALEELSLADDIWDDRFLEPLITQYQEASVGQMYRIMDVLYTHQKSWVKKEGISTILSDLVLYKFENIIYEDPASLGKKELFTASLLIDILGKTGNKEVVPIICPFLKEKERILDTGLVLDPNSMELPRPMRVCDNALEALMRLENMDLIKAYKKAKYKPPYENGEAEIIVTRIRDNMIEDFQGKRNICR